MPFRVTTEKYFATAGEYWTNVYWVAANTMADAITAANSLCTAELALYYNHTVLTKARIDDGNENTDISNTVIKNQTGTRGANTTDMLPLFICARVDFGATDGGRPSRKYLRAVLAEGDTGMAALTTGVLTLLANYGLAVVGTTACDPQGFDLTAASPFTAPQMRQLRRGSKKKVIPSFPPLT
jgi:hypothetical protein